MNDRYPVSQDSVLLASTLGAYTGDSCLEIGVGGGSIIGELSRRFGLAVGTDTSPPGGSGRVNLLRADRATCFRDECFDLVAFNPPYLPSAGVSDTAVDGGADGVDVPLDFLREALRVVRRDGRVVFLLSSYNPIDKVEEECARAGFVVEKVTEKSLFYETLSVYEARHRPRS
ncbi:MAG TPA: hypothetical protein VEJ36_07940 [Nitrososphaerales archaeon]|nr:hypothetical protein [Nitrososphaerales archaeon]